MAWNDWNGLCSSGFWFCMIKREKVWALMEGQVGKVFLFADCSFHFFVMKPF